MLWRTLSRRAATSFIPSARHFTVLAIESSADDTCAAVVTSDKRILSNVVIKQLKLYVPFTFLQVLSH